MIKAAVVRHYHQARTSKNSGNWDSPCFPQSIMLSCGGCLFPPPRIRGVGLQLGELLHCALVKWLCWLMYMRPRPSSFFSLQYFHAPSAAWQLPWPLTGPGLFILRVQKLRLRDAWRQNPIRETSQSNDKPRLAPRPRCTLVKPSFIIILYRRVKKM